MYDEAKTQVRSSMELTGSISEKVGLHQGSSLSLYLFFLIMDVLALGVQDDTTWCMLFVDDIVLCSTNCDGVECKAEN